MSFSTTMAFCPRTTKKERLPSGCFSMPAHGLSMLGTLDSMRLNEILIDVIIQVEGHEFPGHRAVFAASSPYFKAMFSYDLKESQERIVAIHGVTADVMQTIVDYIYTGQCFFSKQNAADVMMTADLFQMLNLKNAAVDYLMKCVDTSNCLLIRKLAEVHLCPQLQVIATQCCRKFFKEVIMQDEFLSLDMTDLVAYLTDDEITVQKEDIVFDAAIKWIKYKRERHSYMPSVLKVVRLPYVSLEYLKRFVAEEPLIKNNGRCIKQVIDAAEFHLSGIFSETSEKLQIRPRRCNSKEVLIVFGGESKIGNFHEFVNEVSYYDPDTKKWATLTLFPGTHHTQAFSAVALGYDIFITGGTIDNRAIGDTNVFYTYVNKWRNVTPMIQPRYHHSTTVVNGDVFAIGGTDGTKCLDHVERYVPVHNEWRVIQPLVHPVKCPAAAAYDDKLYVLGGFADGYVISQSIQVYDTMGSGNWIVLSCPSIDYTCAQAVTLAEKIYLLGGCSKTVKAYDPKTDTVFKVAEMGTKRDNCGATVVRGKIYVTGGVSESNGASLKTAERYCPLLDKWETIPAMPKQLYRHGSVSMRIPMHKKGNNASRRTERIEADKAE